MEDNKIKVLCAYKSGGSDYHRLSYPLNKIKDSVVEGKELKIDFIDAFDENLLTKVLEYDILIYNWDVPITAPKLGELQAKGVKIIYVIDDSFEVSEGNLDYLESYRREYVKNRVKQHMLIANAVITSNGALTLQAMQYSDNIAVIPNFLDPEDFKSTKEVSNKLRVGIFSNASHIENTLTLKGAINRISKNKDLCSKIEFVLCGNDGQEGWKEIIEMFSKKKNIAYTVKDYKPVEEYFDLYSNLDIVLLPLLGTEFNACRSALKLNECAIANILPVGSVLYTMKELNSLVVANKPIDYEKELVKCLDNDYYTSKLKEITDSNLEKADYKTRFENTKSVINSVYLQDLSVKIPELEIYSIKYNEEQLVEYTPVLNVNREKPWRFEYNVFIDKLEEIKSSEKEFFSILSWKYLQKTNLPKQILFKSLYRNSFKDYDFTNITKRHWKSTKEYFKFSEQQHPKLKSLLNKVLNHLGKDFDYYENGYTYSNFFIMKKEFMVDYIENWIIPALEFMENDIWNEINVDANYEGVGRQKLKELTNLDFYNYTSFVLERLIIVYIKEKQLRVLNLL